MPEAILWKDVKRFGTAWAHIRVSLAGGDDTCVCTICNTEVSLTDRRRKRESILLEVARKHFYKHKLNLSGGGEDSAEPSETFLPNI